jgi:phosphopantetheinyl transferase (holo-ACP synthase)
MNRNKTYSRIVEMIGKEEFLNLYASFRPGDWFSGSELKTYPFPGNAASLAGRYLIKKSICDFLQENRYMQEIEIFNNKMGKPVIQFGTSISQVLEKRGINRVECSISHSRHYITGMTILCFTNP